MGALNDFAVISTNEAFTTNPKYNPMAEWNGGYLYRTMSHLVFESLDSDAYSRTYNINNYYKVNKVLTYSSSKEELNEFINK